jgi:hypothetical protein
MPAIVQPMPHPIRPAAIVPAAGRRIGEKALGGNMTRPRAADDFAAIRARMEDLQRERAQAAQSTAAEQGDIAYRRPLSGIRTVIEEQALQRAVARGRFLR